jgi:protein TonB
MLHQLPITNIHLQACGVAADKLTPVAGGHFCTECQRTVHDFTNATAAELAEVRAATPDERLRGQFRLSQLSPTSHPTLPHLRPKLRQFLVVLVLIVVQGFSAQQALAQVQPKGKHTAPASATDPEKEPTFPGVYVEHMPEPPGGVAGLLTFLRNNIQYPASATASGKVFVNFTVQKTGQLADFKVVKGLEPAIDAEALRVVKLMPPWKPGLQNGVPVDVSYTIPIAFVHDAAQESKKQTKK